VSWSWDPSLYAGSAAHYAVGRVPYPAGVADALVGALPLDGTQRLLDVGCGPGSLTLLLAPHVREALGVDTDGDMLAEAARLAGEPSNVRWVRMRAEELPGDLSPVDVVTFAQSFHWMDRPAVAAAVRGMLRPGGAVVHVGRLPRHRRRQLRGVHGGAHPAAGAVLRPASGIAQKGRHGRGGPVLVSRLDRSDPGHCAVLVGCVVVLLRVVAQAPKKAG
jgi:SAM-dependent methyltransferase